MRKLVLILTVFIFTFSLAFSDDVRYLTFKEAAELAVLSSLEYRQMRAAHTLNEQAWRRNIKDYLPHLSLSVSENDRLQMYGADSFIKNYGIGVEQLVWDGGRFSFNRKLERIELDFSAVSLERTASVIGDAAISAYINILTAREILKIRKDAFLLLEEQRRILNEEVQLGLALPLDIASADINLADTRVEIKSLELDLIEMENQFAEILGLDFLPVLSEEIDVNRTLVLPIAQLAGILARENNPELEEIRFSILKMETELKYISRSWIPSLRLIGNFGLSGQQYPLTRYNWSIGISIDFSAPWVQNRFSTQTGFESPSDRTAILQNNVSLLPDPAERFGRDRARLALAFERENYDFQLERVERNAVNAVEKCILLDQKRILALDTAMLAAERCRIEELRLELGQITRLNLMETIIEQTQKEIAAVEAAAALLQAERELERFLNLKPGELENLSERRRTMRKYLNILLQLTLLFCFSCAGNVSQQAELDGNKKVKYAPVVIREIPDDTSGFGSLSFISKVDIASPQDAVIGKLFFREGDSVSAGERIIQLENPQIELSVERAENNYSQAFAAYNLANSRLLEGIFQAEATLLALEKAEAELELVKRKWEEDNRKHQNQEVLFDAGGVHTEAILTGRFNLETEWDQIQLMEKELELRRIGTREQDLIRANIPVPTDKDELFEATVYLMTSSLRAEVNASKARLDAAEKELSSANLALAELTIRSPISGIVGARYLEEGERIKFQDKILTLIDSSSLYAIFPVREKDALRIEKGMSSSVYIDGTGEYFDGVVDLVYPQADSQSLSFLVRVLISDIKEINKLKPGMFVRVKVVLGPDRNALFIPESSIFSQKENEGSVFVINGTVLSERKVTLLNARGDEREISGLNSGELVVLKPDSDLKEGTHVTLTE